MSNAIQITAAVLFGMALTAAVADSASKSSGDACTDEIRLARDDIDRRLDNLGTQMQNWRQSQENNERTRDIAIGDIQATAHATRSDVAQAVLILNQHR